MSDPSSLAKRGEEGERPSEEGREEAMLMDLKEEGGWPVTNLGKRHSGAISIMYPTGASLSPSGLLPRDGLRAAQGL
jgi:hypothetical protein